MPKRYLTPKEVAERFAVHPNKVRAWILSGQLVGTDVSLCPGAKPRYRISEEELERFERRRVVDAAPPIQRRRSKINKIKPFYTKNMGKERKRTERNSADGPIRPSPSAATAAGGFCFTREVAECPLGLDRASNPKAD